MGPPSIGFVCLALFVFSSASLKLFVHAAGGGSFLCTDDLAADATLLWGAARGESVDIA